MGTPMKTTIEIADPLLDEAKRVAAREGSTLRALVEAGLRREIADRRRNEGTGFKLRNASVGGKGLLPELQSAPFSRLLELAYDGRGA